MPRTARARRSSSTPLTSRSNSPLSLATPTCPASCSNGRRASARLVVGHELAEPAARSRDIGARYPRLEHVVAAHLAAVQLDDQRRVPAQPRAIRLERVAPDMTAF